jgi:hypothetical protein
MGIKILSFFHVISSRTFWRVNSRKIRSDQRERCRRYNLHNRRAISVHVKGLSAHLPAFPAGVVLQ